VPPVHSIVPSTWIPFAENGEFNHDCVAGMTQYGGQASTGVRSAPQR
jgi:hypothetical protein